jgi:hypothetical protein
MLPPRLVAVLALTLGVVGSTSPAAGPSAGRGGEPRVAATVVRLLDDAAVLGSLSVSANGQTVYAIEIATGSITAVDPFDPRRRRDVVSPPAADDGRPMAIGCLPGDVLAAVWRDGDGWQLRTHRMRPGAAADPARPEARVPLGEAAGAGDRVAVVVSRTRDWLAVTGLPRPLPPVIRGVFAGAGVRLLPPGEAAPDDARPVAAAVSPADELVLFEAVGDGEARIAFLTPAGRPLLRLRSGLTDVRGAAFSRRDGRLWATAGPGAGRPAALWRLDATMLGGEQAVRPVAVPGPSDPRALVDVPGESLVVVEAGSRPTVLRIDVDDKENP